MANIIEEILRATSSDDTQQETKDAAREAFEQGKEDMYGKVLRGNVDIHFKVRNGEVSFCHLEGNGLNINASLAFLVYTAGMKIGGDKDGALKFIGNVCGAAKYAIDNEGE